MTIEYLEASHADSAAKLVLDNYMEERRSVGILPLHDHYHDLFCKSIDNLRKTGIGVAAVNNGRLIGFLTGMAVNSFKGLNRGVWCPIYSHATISEGKREIYLSMYERISDIWVKNGCLTHAVTMFAHDREAIDTWFWNGFGLRCVDAILPVADGVLNLIPNNTASASARYTVRKVTPDDAEAVLPLHVELDKYLSRPPLFMSVFSLPDINSIQEWLGEKDHHMWAAFDSGSPIAFMKLAPGGETFVNDDPGILNICGAYTRENARGSGAGKLILSAVTNWLCGNGYKRCGVDFESFNRNGSRFWMKYFEAYTFSLMRRIDERVLWANAGRTDGIMI